MGLTSFNRVRRLQEEKKKYLIPCPEKKTCTQEEAEEMISSGEAEIPSEAVVEEAEVVQESTQEEAEEAPAAPKSKKKKNA